MLNFKLKFSDGNMVELPCPVSVVYNSEFSVPADDIVICFPFCKNIDSADYIFAYEKDRLMFKGLVDEIITLKNLSGIFTKVSARSLAGFLIDNEAEPCVYFNVSASVIFDKHLKPYGFENYDCDDLPLYGYTNVAKGFSEWKVLENFCKSKYGKIPRVTSSGKVIFNNTYDRNFIFSDNGENKYYSIKKCVNKFRYISEIKVKLLKNTGYKSVIYNEKSSIDTKALKRRFVDAAVGNATIDTVDRMIKNSNNKSFEIIIECPFLLMDCVGEGAWLLDSFIGEYKDLYIHKIKYSLDDSGEKSVITLRKVD